MYSDRAPSFNNNKLQTFSDKELITWVGRIRSMIGKTWDREKAKFLEIELCYLQREISCRAKLHLVHPVRPSRSVLR